MWSLDGPHALLVRIWPTIESRCLEPCPASETLSMDVNAIVETVQTALRSVGAEVASPWFYLQFGLILAAAGIAWAADAAIRSRVDMSSLAMRWPLPLRHFARVMVFSASTAIFAVEMIASRVVMSHATWPSR